MSERTPTEAVTPRLTPEGQEWVLTTYRHLHSHPELSMQEHATAAAVEDALDLLGVDHFRSGTTGVVGVLRNGDGPVVAFRADSDGLPIAEDTGVSYASDTRGTLPDGQEVPVMHGCGHDVHVASALGAVRVLTEHRDAWAGTVVFVFQPGEETGQGAVAMLTDGLWDKAPRPEVVLGQHVGPYPYGTARITPGPAMAMADSLAITLYGKQSHGSQPQDSVDPIVLGSAVVQRLQGIVSREVDPRESAVVTVGTFHAGLKDNIIPDRAELSVNVRTFLPEVRDLVLAAIERIVRAEAAASGAPEPRIEVIAGFPACINDPEAAHRVRDILAAELGDDQVQLSRALMGSEDVGALWEALGVPGAYWFIGGFDPDDPTPPVNHSPHFAPVAEPTLDTGVRAATAALLAWLDTPLGQGELSPYAHH